MEHILYGMHYDVGMHLTNLALKMFLLSKYNSM